MLIEQLCHSVGIRICLCLSVSDILPDQGEVVLREHLAQVQSEMTQLSLLVYTVAYCLLLLLGATALLLRGLA